MVYVVQMVPDRDVSSAREYGELSVLLPLGDVVLSAGPITQKLQRKLKDFSDADYLLCMGDPVALTLAGAVAAESNFGRFKLLKWDRRKQVYYPIEIDIRRTGTR